MKAWVLAAVALGAGGATANLLANSQAVLSAAAIERAFNLRAGTSTSIAAANGEQYRIEYRRLEALSDDEYAIVVKLKR